MVQKQCNMCPLSIPQQVSGKGPKEAKLILIGEFPNRDDEKSQQPFSGGADSANYIIKKIFSGLGYIVDRDMYMAYALRCHPYHRSDKVKVTTTHLKACRMTNLEPELASVECPIILCMGKEALTSLLPDSELSVMNARGKWHKAVVGGKERLIRVTFSLAQVNRLSLWRVKEENGNIEKHQRWNPIGSCGWFFQQDIRAVYEKMQELGLTPEGV